MTPLRRVGRNEPSGGGVEPAFGAVLAKGVSAGRWEFTLARRPAAKPG